MSDASDNPDLTEVLRLINLAQQSRIWTALPGIVESYDPDTQRAEIKPSLAGFRILTEGEEVENLPNIPNVPVMNPSGGGFFASFPMKKGNAVIMVFSSRDIGPWKAGQGQPVNSQDNRMHDISDAFAFPGGRAAGDVIAEADAEKLIVGQDNGHQIRIGTGVIDIGTSAGIKEAAALATKTKTEVSSLSASFDAFIGVWTAFVAVFNPFVVQTAAHTHQSVNAIATSTEVPPDGPQPIAPSGTILPAIAGPGSQHGAVNDVGSASVNIEV